MGTRSPLLLVYGEDIIAPTVTGFALDSGYINTLTVGIDTFTATDEVGVTGYWLGESAEVPSLEDAGWSETVPANFTCSTAGNITVYARVRDEAGNISDALSDSVFIIVDLLLDLFTDTRAAGSVNGTPATPGPGDRYVIDTANHASINSGKSIMNGAASTLDPRWLYDSGTRQTGSILIQQLQIDVRLYSGWFINQGGSVAHYFYWNAGPVIQVGDSVALVRVADISQDVDYYVAIVLRNNGAYHFIKGGAFSNWTLLKITANGNTTPLYPGYANGDSTDISSEFIRYPDPSYTAHNAVTNGILTPLAYDTFTSPVTTAADSGSNGLDGTYTACGLGGATNGAFFDGASSYVNIYSAGLNSAFNGQEFGIVVQAKSPNASGLSGVIPIIIRADTNNRLSFVVTAGDANCFYNAGGTLKSDTLSGVISSTLSGFGGTFSKTSDSFKLFANGSQDGSTISGLGSWTGNLASDRCVIGCNSSSSPANIFYGWIKNVIITLNGVVPSDAQMQALTNTATTITAALLDGYFGAGNYVWYKLDEVNSTLTTGPDGQTATALDWETSTGAISSGELAVTPVLGAELLTNGGLEAPYDDESGGGGGTINVATGWDNRNCKTDGSDVLDECDGGDPGGNGVSPYAGLSCQYFYVNANGKGIIEAASSFASNGLYKLSGHFYGIAGTYRLKTNTIELNVASSNTGSWIELVSTGYVTAGATITIQASGGAAEFYTDALSLKEVTLSSCIAGIDEGSNENILVSVDLTTTDNTQNGWFIHLDSLSNPLYYVAIYQDRVSGKIYYDQVTNGSVSNIGSVAFTYSATATMDIWVNGTSVRLIYNNTYLATFSITVNPYYKAAAFMTDSASRQDNVLIMPVTGDQYDTFNQYVP